MSGILHDLKKFDPNNKSLFRYEFEMEHGPHSFPTYTKCLVEK